MSQCDKHSSLSGCTEAVKMYAALVTVDPTMRYSGLPDKLIPCIRAAKEALGETHTHGPGEFQP